ncbi:MAG: hypothetical protein PHS79_02345 [Patescibacteria group bacterium]|nr:hypothetical protein [Patescibacteria group bacterium]
MKRISNVEYPLRWISNTDRQSVDNITKIRLFGKRPQVAVFTKEKATF